MCMRDEPILARNQIGVILARVRPSGTDTGTSSWREKDKITTGACPFMISTREW